jgi:tetratricopeptide (TPR) repeat protein
MALTIKRDLIQGKSLLVLLKLVSLPGIVHQSLALLIAVLLVSESVAATPKQFSPLLNRSFTEEGWGGSSSIAQQRAATEQDATRAAAKRAFQEGVQLYKQGTAESLRQAIAKFEEALPLYRAVGDTRKEAVTLNNIGYIYSALGENQKALDYYNQSLPLIRATGGKAGEAVTLNNIGAIYNASGEKQKALEYLNQALPLSRTTGDKATEAVTLYNVAYLEGNRGNLNVALTQIEASITILEDLRTKIGSQELRASYFATVQDYYEFYINLLMQLHKTNPNKGYDAQALHASERARARSLLELLTEANANIRQGANPKLLDEERTLQQQLSAAEYKREQLLKGQYTDKQLTEIKQQIETLLTRLQQLEGEIRVNSPRYAALKYPQPLNLQQIQQQVLDDNTLLLEYSLGKDHSYLWAVTKTGITSYELPPRADIETAAQEFYKQLKSETGNIEEGMKLSQMLLAPVMNQLGNKRLLIVGDGVLQSIPFAALPIPEKSGVRSHKSEVRSQESVLPAPRPVNNDAVGQLTKSLTSPTTNNNVGAKHLALVST